MKSEPKLESWGCRAVRILQHDLTICLLVAGLLAVSAGVIAAARHDPAVLAANTTPLLEEPAPAPEPEPVAEAPEPEPPAAPPLDVVEGRLVAGDTLAGRLRGQRIPVPTIHLIDREMRPVFDFRRSRAGHRYRLARDLDGSVVEFRYAVTDLESFVLRPVPDAADGEPGWRAIREEAVLVPRVSRIAGVVSTTLHEAIVALGERGQLAHDFSEIFAWDIDFSRSVQPGDEFRILYERLYRPGGSAGDEYIRPGRILAARYRGAMGDVSAIYFEPTEGRGGYYRPDGSSVERAFLQAPLRYSRISSRFTPARHHPILKVTRPHHGIDYAAPQGTPLWSVADGRVIYRGWAGGFGNLVKIRHANGYVSYYAHLSRFASGLAVGQAVSQKQVIGFVGSTGLATGPHVCFRVAKDGRYVDPASLRLPEGVPLPVDKQHLFVAARDVLLAELDGGTLVAVEEAL